MTKNANNAQNGARNTSLMNRSTSTTPTSHELVDPYRVAIAQIVQRGQQGLEHAHFGPENWTTLDRPRRSRRRADGVSGMLLDEGKQRIVSENHLRQIRGHELCYHYLHTSNHPRCKPVSKSYCRVNDNGEHRSTVEATQLLGCASMRAERIPL